MGTKGKCIVLEGIDGSGKSTQAEMLYEKFCDDGQDAILTCEPTNGPVGKLIRQVLAGEKTLDQRAIANLFAADRTDHLLNEKNGMRHLVDQGKTVICDRYYFSSYAYHSQYMDMDWIFAINQYNAQILKPNLTFFIDVPPKTCVERIKASRDSLDMYETIEILTNVRENYLAAFQRLDSTEKIIIVDGQAPPEKISQKIWHAVNQNIYREP